MDYLDDGLYFDAQLVLEVLGYSSAVICISLVYQYILKKNLWNAIIRKDVYCLFFMGAILCALVNIVRTALYDESLGWISSLNFRDILPLYLVFIAVVFEELLFRKYLVELGRGLGLSLIVSCLLSAVLFAFWHTATLSNSWHLILSGLIYSYFTYRFKSISFSIGLHFMYNLLVTFSNHDHTKFLLEDSYEYVSPATSYLSIKFDLSTLAIFLIVDSLINRKRNVI